MISIIATIGKNNELAKNKISLWDLPSDLKFFKKITINHTIVMDEDVYNQNNRIFSNRYNIVVSNTLKDVSGVEIVKSVEEILKRFKDTQDDVYIIGGKNLFDYFLKYADKVFLTVVDEQKDADEYFPILEKNNYEYNILEEIIENNISYKHVLYVKSSRW
mgnify:CR=1 FL=1